MEEENDITHEDSKTSSGVMNVVALLEKEYGSRSEGVVKDDNRDNRVRGPGPKFADKSENRGSSE
jgi:hypothetical protein